MKFEFVINSNQYGIKTQKYLFDTLEALKNRASAMVDDLPTITNLQINVVWNSEGWIRLKSYNFKATSKAFRDTLNLIAIEQL